MKCLSTEQSFGTSTECRWRHENCKLLLNLLLTWLWNTVLLLTVTFFVEFLWVYLICPWLLFTIELDIARQSAVGSSHTMLLKCQSKNCYFISFSMTAKNWRMQLMSGLDERQTQSCCFYGTTYTYFSLFRPLKMIGKFLSIEIDISKSYIAVSISIFF